MTVPTIDTILKMKAGNPDLVLSGQTKRVYDEFVAQQEAIENARLEKEAKKAERKKNKKVKQVMDTPTSVEAEVEAQSYENDNEEIAELLQSEKEDYEDNQLA